MAKQDAITDHPYQTEKDSAASGACKDKQLKRKDPVDVASLSVSELPSNARHLDSPHPSRRSSPQVQLQSSSHHPRPPSGSPPTQSLLLLQEHPPSNNTSPNKPNTTSPAGVKADKSLNDPLPSNFTAALAVDLDLTSVATLDNSHQHTKTNAGLARWHSWVMQQTRNNEFTDNVALLTGNRDSVLEITPSAVIHYLEDVVLPLEQASYSMISDSTADTTNLAESGKGATSVIEIYLMPVLQLWQHQYQVQEKQRLGHQRQQQRRQLEQPCRHPDPSSSSSSVTMSSELKSLHEGISDDRATVANVQYTTRQQDQLLRLIRLEKSHQNTALVISQLQDQFQRLIDERAHYTKYKLQSRQDKDHNILPASDNEPESNGSVSLAAMSGRHASQRPYSTSTRQRLQRQQQQQQQTGGYYGGKGESHRAEELIEVIARGLEEYHARVANERTRQSSGTDTTTAAHDHPSWQHIDSLNENVLEHSHHPQSTQDRAVDYQYEQETLDRSSGSQQHPSDIYYGEQSPSQHSHHSYHHQRHKHKQQQAQAQQMHAELQQDDLLEVPPHHSLNDRPVRSRKRSSSMGGPGGVHKENIKQARSCSPPRPRTTPDNTQTGLDGSAVTPVAAVAPNGHMHSQAPIIPVGKSLQESRLDGHLNSSKNNISIDISASSTAAASLAMLHYGSVDRARQHSASPHHTDYHTHQQPAHPYSTSAQRLQERNDKVSDRYPSHPPQDHAFNYAPSQITRIAPPPYGEDDYRSYSDHPHPPLRHHSHPSQSYSHIEDIALESVEPAEYESHEIETRVSPRYIHTAGTTTTLTEPKLPVFRGKHNKHQESFGHSGRTEPAHQRRLSHPSPSQQTSAPVFVGKPHPYQRDESRVYSGYEPSQQQQHQQQHQHQQQLPQLSHRHDIADEDVKSSHAQIREYQHQHQHHYHYSQTQQLQQLQQQQQVLFHQQRQQHHFYHNDSYNQQSLQSSSTSSPPLSSSSNQHQHQHHPPPPIYIMNRQVNTVPELWKEWTVGLGTGNPSIRQLEAQYGPSWRTSSSAANFFSRRLRIIHEIQRMVDYEGLTEEEAVNRLEARREQGVVIPGSEGHSNSGDASGGTGMSLHRLSEILRKKQL